MTPAARCSKLACVRRGFDFTPNVDDEHDDDDHDDYDDHDDHDDPDDDDNDYHLLITK